MISCASQYYPSMASTPRQNFPMFFNWLVLFCTATKAVQKSLPKVIKSERTSFKIYLNKIREDTYFETWIYWLITIYWDSYSIFNLYSLIKLNLIFLLAQDPAVKITLYIEVPFLLFTDYKGVREGALVL